jgi:hypothetical protein
MPAVFFIICQHSRERRTECVYNQIRCKEREIILIDSLHSCSQNSHQNQIADYKLGSWWNEFNLHIATPRTRR